MSRLLDRDVLPNPTHLSGMRRGVSDESGPQPIDPGVAAALLGVGGGSYRRATWAELEAIVPTQDAAPGEVTDDAATHTDPVVGGTVPNEGLYSYHITAPIGWERVGDRQDAEGLVAAEAATRATADVTEAATRLAQDTLISNATRDAAFISGAVMTRYARISFGAAGVNGRPASATATFNRSMTFVNAQTGAVLSTGTSYVHSSATPLVVDAYRAVSTSDDFTLNVTNAALIDDLELLQRFFSVVMSTAPHFRGELSGLVHPYLKTLSTPSVPYNADLRAFGRSRILEILSLGSCGLTGSVSVFEGITTLKRLFLSSNPLIVGDIGAAIAQATAFERLQVDNNPLLTLADPSVLPATASVTQMIFANCPGLGLNDLAKGAAFSARIAAMTMLNSVNLQNLGILTPNLDAIVMAIRENADANSINGGTLNIAGNPAGLSEFGADARAALIAAPRLWTVTGP